MLTNRYIEIKRPFHWFKSSMNPATKEVNAEDTGKYSPRFIFVPLALVVSGQIKDWANSKVIKYLSLNKPMSGRIQDGAKSFASEEGRK